MDSISTASAKKTEIAVALSGGGIYFLAHLTVLEALKNEGFEIKAIAGTSAGAIAGLLFSLDVTTKEIRELATKESSVRNLFTSQSWLGVSNLIKHKLGQESTLKHFLDVLIKLGIRKFPELMSLTPPHLTIQKLPIECIFVAANTLDKKPIVHDRNKGGSAIRAVLESSNLLIVDQQQDTKILDGCLVDNLPYFYLRDHCYPIIAPMYEDEVLEDGTSIWSTITKASQHRFQEECKKRDDYFPIDLGCVGFKNTTDFENGLKWLTDGYDDTFRRALDRAKEIREKLEYARRPEVIEIRNAYAMLNFK
ncbi:MAG: patatin-like phospholipase family protein [Methylobacter sp.]